MFRRVIDQRRGQERAFKTVRFRFFEALPFGWAEVPTRRRELCDYCFFGGPDKTTLLPEADGF